MRGGSLEKALRHGGSSGVLRDVLDGLCVDLCEETAGLAEREFGGGPIHDEADDGGRGTGLDGGEVPFGVEKFGWFTDVFQQFAGGVFARSFFEVGSVVDADLVHLMTRATKGVEDGEPTRGNPFFGENRFRGERCPEGLSALVVSDESFEEVAFERVRQCAAFLDGG